VLQYTVSLLHQSQHIPYRTDNTLWEEAPTK
jgi:hypothetical protein